MCTGINLDELRVCFEKILCAEFLNNGLQKKHLLTDQNLKFNTPVVDILYIQYTSWIQEVIQDFLVCAVLKV